MKKIVTICWVLVVHIATAQHKEDSVGSTRPTAAHDPVMIKQDGRSYLFCTGRGIPCFSSAYMRQSKKEKPVFSSAPQWAREAVPSFRGHILAPGINYHSGLYYLYKGKPRLIIDEL